MIIFLIYIALFGFFIATLIDIRKKMYNYSRNRDFIYNFDNAIEIENFYNLDLSSFESKSIVLAIRVSSNPLGYLFAPYVEINSKQRIYFEHGLNNALRYIDLTYFTAQKGLKFKFHHCFATTKKARVFTFDNIDFNDKKVLILAPHADDAEIAAFGLYSDTNSYIVTISASEGDCDFCDIEESKQERSKLKGDLRVVDALSVPMIGGVCIDRVMVLGYFCETLKSMYENRDKIIASKTANLSDINYFRRVKHTKIELNQKPLSSWSSLVDDLNRVLEEIKPDIIVTPNIALDSNKDHKYTTIALAEAMDFNMKEVKILTYTNHHTHNELYPYGAIFSTSSLAPKFGDDNICSGIYSHQLDRSKQVKKFYALESMHDLRDPLVHIGFSRAFAFAFKQLRRVINGKEKSYYRRAVRTNEIFYYLDYEKLKKACEDLA